MRRRTSRTGEEASVDMTPMLDIVFIMLIFFIVAAVFLDERGIALAEAPDAPASPAPPLPAILVQIDADDVATVDGALTDLASVPSRIEVLRASQPTAVVILQANAASSVEAVVRLKDDFDSASIPVTLKIAEAAPARSQ